MAIAGYIRIPVMAYVDALPNGPAIGTRPSAFAEAFIPAMLTDMVPFFDEILIGWCVPFLTSDPGTLRIRVLMSAPSPCISRIRSSAVQVGLKSTLSAGFPFGWN
jgi:hypothetical protein